VGGRVLENADTPDKFMTGVYVSGWVKRGPSGIIGKGASCECSLLLFDLSKAGTNKFDAQETVMKITEDWKEGKLKQEPLAGADGLREYLTDAVSFEEWKRIEQKEYCDGKATGKVRLKVFDIKELLQLAKANTPA
jgi:NADPH-dependent glutamate synthase beta subunit-like oxidoreductase